MKPEQLINQASFDGLTKANAVSKKRGLIKNWLTTEDGKAYLKLLQDGTAPLDSYNNMVREEAGLRNPAEQKGQLIKSKRGTYALLFGTKAYPLTRNECATRNLIPGPGNN